MYLKSLFAAMVTTVCFVSAEGKVQLPSLMSSDMVLQRNAEVNIWGKAKPGVKVSVTPSWSGKKYTTKADAEGRWITKIATADAGGPYTLTISDGEPVELKDVMLGEVWICSGQSNMEMQVHGYMHQAIHGSVDAITDAGRYSDMRLFTVGRNGSGVLSEDCEGEWRKPTPKSVADFSAVSYFFGRTLSKVLDVPVGLIASCWGDSPVETWMDEDTFNSVEGINREASLKRTAPYHKVANLYKGMINPITNYTAKGFIWYQGETNRIYPDDYAKLLPAMIGSWREKWGNSDMPFYMVQLAPYRYEGNDGMSLPLFIEAQYKVADSVPKVGVAATTDVGNELAIHPGHKQEVGDRLAYLALANDYDVEGLPLPAPRYKSMTVNDNKVTLTFTNLVEHPDWWDGNAFHTYYDDRYITPKGFEIAGEDRVFYPASGSYGHGKNTIELYSDSVPHPVAVRYYFHNFVRDANAVTSLGQPLVPFRTDNWPIEKK